MDDVFIAIPWRSRGDSYREKSLQCIKELLFNITNIEPVLVDGKRNEFSLSESRNVGVKTAKKENKNIVVICDADTIVESDTLFNAINLARQEEHVIIPYTTCKPLTEISTNLYHEGVPYDALTPLISFDWSVGGVYVTSISAWEFLGGQDERFTNWGCEDTAFSIVADKMGRPLKRVDGSIYPLWHPSYVKHNEDWYLYNSRLLNEYAEIDPEKLREEISERRRSSWES